MMRKINLKKIELEELSLTDYQKISGGSWGDSIFTIAGKWVGRVIEQLVNGDNTAMIRNNVGPGIPI